MSGLPALNLFGSDVEPARLVADRGRPAPLLARLHGGLPAYETDDGAAVMETLICVAPRSAELGDPPRLLPHSYGKVVIRAPGGFAALHDAVDAAWIWRPALYALKASTTERAGSQRELEWRLGLHQAEVARVELHDRLAELAEECVDAKVPYEEYRRRGEEIIAGWEMPKLDFLAARERADRLLLEHLSPQQRLEYAACRAFRVRGAASGDLYLIQPGDGFQRLDPLTSLPLVSYCLHPEEWLPDGDVALALKLALEDPDGEPEVLAGARARARPAPPPPLPYDRHAQRLERDLIR